jgi:hypothetical protein
VRELTVRELMARAPKGREPLEVAQNPEVMRATMDRKLLIQSPVGEKTDNQHQHQHQKLVQL